MVNFKVDYNEAVVTGVVDERGATDRIYVEPEFYRYLINKFPGRRIELEVTATAKSKLGKNRMDELEEMISLHNGQTALISV